MGEVLKRNGVLIRDSEGALDEAYFEHVEMIHLERMSETGWNMIIDQRGGGQWIVNFGAINERAKTFMSIEEDAVNGFRIEANGNGN